MIPNPFDALDDIKSIGTWMAVLFLFLMFVVLPPFAAYKLGWHNRDQQVQLDTKDAQLGRLQALIVRNDFNAQIAGDYVLRRASTQFIYRTIREQVPHVVTHYVRVPGAAPEPVPACVFTHGFVRVWNEALHGDPGAEARDAGGSASALSRAGAVEAAAEADLFDAGLAPGDVLENLIANAKVATEVRQQCDAIRAYALGPQS